MVTLAKIAPGLGPPFAGLTGLAGDLSPGWLVLVVVSSLALSGIALVFNFLVGLAGSQWAVEREITRREQLREQARIRRRARKT